MAPDGPWRFTPARQNGQQANELHPYNDHRSENGYLPRYDVLLPGEVKELQTQFNSLEDSTGKSNAQYSLHNIHLKYPWVLNLAAHPKVLDPVKQILGEGVILLDSRFICKYPETDMPAINGETPYVAWHQDVRYWGVDGVVVTAWLAIDDADEENGCMCVIPGSHTLGLLEHRSAESGGNLLTSNQSIPYHLFEASKSTPCPLRAGQMSLHHGLLVHGSDPNRSNRRRCGYVIRFVSTDAKPIQDEDRPRTFPATVLVSGEDKNKHFQNHQPEWSA